MTDSYACAWPSAARAMESHLFITTLRTFTVVIVLIASFYCKQCSLRKPYNVQEHKRPTSRLAHNNPAPLELVEACSPIRHLLFCPDGLGWCRGRVLAVDGIRHGIVSMGPLGLS